MYFSYHWVYYPEPFEPNHYIREMLIDVICQTEADGETVAARMAIDHLDFDRPMNEGQDIYEICDADSSGWETVFSHLFEPGTQAEWRQDFQFDEPIRHVLFMHRCVFHAALESWKAYILDHVASLAGDESAFVMWRDLIGLPDSIQSDLGFRNIAGSDLRLRPNMLTRNYSATNEYRSVLDLVVPEDAGDFVKANWVKPV